MSKLLPILALWLAASSAAMAQNSVTVQGFTVHYNAFKAEFLSPEIAAQYGIQRSKYRGVLNVSVIREQAGTTGTAVAADIDAEARELTGKLKPLHLREVREQEAIYYVDDFPIVDGETVRFELQVRPEGDAPVLNVKYEQAFYVD